MSEEKKKGIAPSAADVNKSLISSSSFVDSISPSSSSSSSSPPSSSSFPPPPSFSSIQLRIQKLEKEIEETKKRRDKHEEGNSLWTRADNELVQLRDELKQLRDELKQRRTKEEELKRNQLTGKKKKKNIIQRIIVNNHVFMSFL
jgi:hypothetical protein